MRIALVAPYAWPQVRRGGERYLDDLTTWLRAAGHDVDVVTGEGHRLHTVAARRGLTEVDTFGLAAWGRLARGRHDVVHALVPSAAVAARLAGRPTLYTVLGIPRAAHLQQRPLARRLLGSAVRRATAVAALSTPAAAAVHALTGRSAHVLPPGLRAERFPVERAPRRGPARVLFPADASDPRKGLGLALAALDLLLRERPDARLLVAGPGDAGPALREATAAARAATDVLGVGAPDDVPRRYREASVTVLPARHEAFGLVLVESLASGTPAVASDEGGPGEVLDDPAVGRTFRAGDPAALAAALRHALELAAAAGTPARCAEHARRWHWDRVGAQHEALYAQVRRGRTP